MNGEPITARELAALLGVSARTIRELAQEGVVVKTGKGRYALAASVRAYCERQRAAAAGRGGESGVATLTAERARLAREQADAAAIKNAALRGDLLPAADVAASWRAILTGVRARMLAVPSRIGARAAHLSRADLEIVDSEIRDALEDASHAG